MPASIHSRLLLLVLAVLLPGMLGAAWLIGNTFQAERQARERTLRDTARALSMVVDRELSRRATIARLLAQSRWLDGWPEVSPEHLLDFDLQAQRALRGLDGWVELRTEGRTLVDTRDGHALVERPSAAPLSDIGLVLPLQPGRTPGDAYAALVEPIQRNETTVANVVVSILPSELQHIVDSQSLPPRWVGTVMDTHGVVVARHPGGAQHLGEPATPDLRARMARSAEGLLDSVTLDGMASTAYYSTSPMGWTYVGAMPRDEYGGVLPQGVLRVVLGALALLALGVGGALWVARRIARPVLALKDAAERMQAGLPIEPTPTGIVECDEVAHALADAGRTVRQNRADLERQVAEAIERTRQAEQAASQSQRVEALGRLTGGVAHDFNNLLGVISNSAHLMQRHPASAELRSPLAAALRAVEVGSQLTQHLLRFAGRRPMRPQQVHLARYLPELQELLRSVLGARIEVSVRIDPDTQPVHLDPGELEMALINLALNARDAMPRGGELQLRAGNADAEDTAGLPERPLGYVRVAVSDDGEGLAPEVAARAFEPFFTTKAPGKGTGLGLSQVHGFCRQAGGTVQLNSTPGLGTTVSMLLPASDETALQAAAPPAPAAGAVRGARVLLVEDNEALGDVTAALLQSHGAQVQRAAHAGDALRLLDTLPFVDVVLSDVVIPGGMDGLALAQHLRRQRPALPVVLISGYSTTAADTRDFVVLRKPCPEGELLAALHDAIGRTGAPQRA